TETNNMEINMNNMEEQTQASQNTNSTKVEMINSTENNLIILEMQMTATKTTQLGDTEWLYLEGFIPVVNKRSTVSKKNKQTNKSRFQEAENRPFLYGKKGRDHD
ncbi:18566_t:CDS:2, partial [Gigaspora margarita]